MMTNGFFAKDTLLLGSDAARTLYEEVRDLPIIDYHCHLDPRMIAENARFEDIGSFWLAHDHYKWRAMRLCGVEERYITGNASYREKFLKYAEILPLLCGNPLYYWTHMELSMIFGIKKPLCAENADQIYDEASEQLKGLSVLNLLERFGVEYIATTDDPTDDLSFHGTHGKTRVCPTFRPDKVWTFDPLYLEKLGKIAGCTTDTLDGCMTALLRRLDYFYEKGCRISDHGFEHFPKTFLSREEAARLYEERAFLSEDGRTALFGYILSEMMLAYKKRSMTAQLHFGVTRNVNKTMYARIGVDSGFDVMSAPQDVRDVIAFLARFEDDARPDILLYTLNDVPLSSLACMTGAFRGVRMGAAWWFCDTVGGIRRNLETVAEFTALGRSVGMLTDSRSFSSYARFDFFRRILADFIGGYVTRGEYDMPAASALMKSICYDNAKALVQS